LMNDEWSLVSYPIRNCDLSSQRFTDTRYTTQGSMLLGVYFFTCLIHPSIHNKGEKREREMCGYCTYLVWLKREPQPRVSGWLRTDLACASRISYGSWHCRLIGVESPQQDGERKRIDSNVKAVV
jgi:hypothetical protein